MEEKHKELLQTHRAKFASSVDVERLYPILQSNDVLDTDDIVEINSQPSPTAKVNKLLDIIQTKPNLAFLNLCQALETTYPHLLTVMFLGRNQRGSTATDSQSLSLTSDSEEDVLSRSSTNDSRSQEIDGARTYTRIIPSYEYDYESSTYPGLSSQDGSHRKSKQQVEQGKQVSVMNGENCQVDSRHREYDRLKRQCEMAMSEVQSLKRLQEDTVKMCDKALRETEMYRTNYKTAILQIQQTKEDKSALQAQVDQLLSDKKHLEQEIINLKSVEEENKEEICELIKQQREVMSESGSSEVISKLYEETVDKCKSLKEERDLIRKEYSELKAKNKEVLTKSALLSEENTKLRKQHESLCAENNAILLERNGLKQQCTAAIHDLGKLAQQRDDMMKESNRILAVHLQKLDVVVKERDAARKEYQLVWAERDSVHKEIEQLHDKVSEHVRKIQTLEKEKENTAKEIETLRQDILTAYQKRDAAYNERDETLKKYGDVKSINESLESQKDEFRKDIKMVTQERDIARKERHEAIKDRDRILRETYERERTQKEQAEEMDQVSKETEVLKRTIEKLQHDLNDAKTEAELSKKNRDWALGERDKIVQEREGIRSLCESLRHQRDRAVSDKAQALRDYDNLKKEKIEACKDLKELREKYECVIEKEARKNQLNGVGHNHSRDSAIDADLQELETEIVDVELRGLNPDNLGFELVGGKDDPQVPNDNSLYVSHVTKGSAADGKLKVNDVVVQINNMDVTNVEKRTVIQSLCNSSHISMLVRRRRCITPRIWQPIQLNISLGKDIGIHIEQGLYVARINPGSTVAKEGTLSTGDRIVSVNGNSVENLTPKELMRLLQECSDPVVIDIWRQMSPINSLGSSPTPVNQTVLSSLQDHMMSHYSKSDSMKPPMSDANDNCKTPMKVRSSESQTDGIDGQDSSHWIKDRKGDNKDLDHKSRISGGHMFDKAMEKFEKLKIFRPRHKSQERHDLDDCPSKTDIMTAPVTTGDDVITEFDFPNAKFEKTGSNRQKSGRKRELENENSGTWPKCYRGLQPALNGTVVLPSSQKRHERPSVENVFKQNQGDPISKTPPTPPERTVASLNAVRQSPHHSPQSSDSTIKYSSPVNSPKTSSKSAPYLPNNSSNMHPNPLTFNPDSAVLTADRNYHSQKHVPHNSRSTRMPVRRNPPSSQTHDSLWKERSERTIPHNVRSRPKSATDRDKFGNSSISHHKSSHIHSSNDSCSSGKGPVFDRNYNASPNPRFSSDFTAFDLNTTSFPDRMSIPHMHGSQSHRFHNGSTPVSVVRPHSSYSSTSSGGHIGQTSAPVHSHAQMSSNLSPYSSPTGSFPDYDFEVRRPSPSYPEAMCSSPCPSQISSTPSDQHNYNMQSSRNSSYSRVSSDYDPSSLRIQRIWIPTNVPSTKSGSVEVVSARSSPGSPMFNEEAIISLESLSSRRRKPQMGETRKINIERTSQPVGFQIGTGADGGVFVSGVSENSLAAEAGLVIGDQLLEICGINMRTATQDMAATFLRQTGNTLSLLVQYNPEEYNKAADSSGESTSTSPVNSPDSTTYRKTSNASQRLSIVSCDLPCERWLTIKKNTPSASLGISIVGGNAVGIFINEVQPNSLAFGHDGLHGGDQILEYNGMNFKGVTAEEAMSELSKPCSSVRLRVQYNPAKFHQVRNQSGGDLFYVRAHFDHKSSSEAELSFRRDDIMLVENTMWEGKPGNWFAWLVNDEGQKLNHKGVIPSKEKLEVEFDLKRSHSESLSLHDLEDTRGSTRRGSGSARSSFFRRKGKHKRNNSKDSREFNSFSDASLNSDSVPVLDDGSLYKYTKVERMEYKQTRPVILLAPLAEPLINKLVAESPDKYIAGQPSTMQTAKQVMEQGLADGSYLDYWQQDDHFECICVSTIKEICDQGIHCLLSISPTAIERLHRLQIYPIVIFARHRSHKQLREITDPRFLSQKLSTKSAKDLYDKYQKLERDYQHQFSAVIQGGNLAEMHQQIKTVIGSEQKKSIWVPVCPVV